MIHINRQTALQEFTKFVNKEHPQNWSTDFVLNHHSLYEHCRNQLEADQGGLSAYTELRLDDKPGIKHIDHFRKQALFPKFVFDWYNYVVDNHEKKFGSDFKDEHIKTIADNEKLIDPIREDAAHFFEYLVSGKIIPSHFLTNDYEKERAQFTIDSFNLNHEFLKRRRADLISEIKNYSAGGISNNDIKSIIVCNLGFPSFVDFVINNIISSTNK
jgi:uncharacterized protein (TIGR02646 family)